MKGSIVRVLVVDDYEPWRRFVYSTLQRHKELQVVGSASDGLEAIQQAEQLQPDLIVLDIGLPALNGMEAARRILELCPKVKILVLSENRSWYFAVEALRAGALGYVVKSDAARELLPSVEAVLAGKRFISAGLAARDLADVFGVQTDHPHNHAVVVPISTHPAKVLGRHEVGFYVDEARFLNDLAEFVGVALTAGNAAIAVATQPHRNGLLEKLRRRGVNIRAAIEQGRYLALDAAATLWALVENGRIDPASFLRVAGDLIATVGKAAKGDPPRVAICGECDPPLWTLGNGEAAIHLEQLWNEVVQGHDVDILCGYFVGDVQAALEGNLFQRIRAQHSAVYSR